MVHPCLSTHIPTYLPTYLTTYLPNYLPTPPTPHTDTQIHTYIRTHASTNTNTHIRTYAHTLTHTHRCVPVMACMLTCKLKLFTSWLISILLPFQSDLSEEQFTFQYGPCKGDPGFREQLAHFLSQEYGDDVNW